MTTKPTPDAILPLDARKWVYRIAIILGALIFLAAIVLKATGHNVIGGVVIDPETGVIALVLAALGALAHANLGNGPGILAAVEALSPKVAEVINAAATAGQKAQEVIASDPALETLLRAELVKLLPAGMKPGKKTKTELIAIIRAARKGNA